MASAGLRNAASKAATGTAVTAAEAVVPVEDNRPQIVRMLTDPEQRVELARALPPGLSEERFNRMALTLIKSNPQLLELGASPEGCRSLIQAIHRCAQLGLEPGNDLGHAYLLPFRMNGKLILQFIIGYKGILAMARRSGGLKRLDIHEVYERDEFEYSYGLGGTLMHKPALRDRGDIICYYGFAEFTDGGYYYTVLTLDDIKARKMRSASVKAGKRSPWDTDEIAMSKKTVARAMAPYLPLAPEMQDALALDEQEIRPDGSTAFIDIDVVNRSDRSDSSTDSTDKELAAGSPEPEPEAAGPPVDVPATKGCTCPANGIGPASDHASDCALNDA